MIKKIISVIVVVFALAVVVKCTTNKDVGKEITDGKTELVDAYKNAHLGDTCRCVWCENEIVKKLGGEPFCSDECKANYEKMVKVTEKTDEVIQKSADTMRDVGKVIKDNWKKD